MILTPSEQEIIKTVAVIDALVGVIGCFLITDHDPHVALMGWILCAVTVAWALGFGCCLIWMGRRR